MKRKVFKNAPKFDLLQDLAIVIQSGDQAAIRLAVHALRSSPAFSGTAWQSNFAKLIDIFSDGSPRYSIFSVDGNSKLPFVSFSTLPGVTCPGAGDCIRFCYSYRAWRYPAAFARMAQNAWLMRFNTAAISTAFAEIAANRPDGFDFRLYVDGDFSNGTDVAFWMELLKSTPTARAYGYSKSFAALLGYNLISAWPENYQLNISSGHNASPAMLQYVKDLPITRGEFIAVSIGRKVKGTEHGTAAVNQALRNAMPDQKIFPCPGTCGSCTGKGHACGMPQLKGRTIAIAIH